MDPFVEYTIGDVIITLLFWGIPAVIFWFMIIGTVWLSKKNAKMEPKKKSQPSDDFMVESRRVINFIKERDGLVTTGLLSKEEKKELEELYDSSGVASLFRFAHYAGYHITFEQNECKWSDDPEYLDPKVFKTDMGEAAALSEERMWDQYKRYHDPPMSERERLLKKYKRFKSIRTVRHTGKTV